MAFSSCFSHAQMPFKVDDHIGLRSRFSGGMAVMSKRSLFAFGSLNTKLFTGSPEEMGTMLSTKWSSSRRSIANIQPNLGRAVECRKGSRVAARDELLFDSSFRSLVPASRLESIKNYLLGYAGLSSSQLADSAFTLGTAAVLPFYTLMVAAPKAEFLSAIAKLFSSETTLASAWIHLLVIDLFAARQVFHDGLQANVETRHSVSLCLLCCPIGILAHFITKTLTSKVEQQFDS
ncbi:hypothetical protein ACH5RR_013838 [Cinchona calisaya]|uniref:Protein ABA DEFICIENT 4, chloroplastic n=1 Tax=Cinchona calisaya TaxID=153742 RepID=A0ABD3A167_9GENT